MTTEELVREACRKAKLPSIAEDQIPQSLSEETKRLVQKLGGVDELAAVLKRVVDRGSVETIDTLIRRELS